jgi:hypothetical protein
LGVAGAGVAASPVPAGPVLAGAGAAGAVSTGGFGAMPDLFPNMRVPVFRPVRTPCGG